MLGKSSKQIKELYNLKIEPTHISEVLIPAGERVLIGEIGPNAFGKSEGAMQYEILGKIKEEWFTNIRLIP